MPRWRSIPVPVWCYISERLLSIKQYIAIYVFVLMHKNMWIIYKGKCEIIFDALILPYMIKFTRFFFKYLPRDVLYRLYIPETHPWCKTCITQNTLLEKLFLQIKIRTHLIEKISFHWKNREQLWCVSLKIEKSKKN